MNATFGNWTIDLIALLSALATVAALIVTLWPILQQRRTEHLLKKSFGSELYESGEIWQSTRFYIPAYCSNVDPAGEAEIRNVIAPKTELFTTIDEFIDKDSRYRHMLILADSGMGKTSCLLNYYMRNQRRYSLRYRIALVPLGHPNIDKYIEGIEQKNQTVIFLDAFDEDTKAIEDHRARLAFLMEACRDFKRVVITCRTQFFHRDEEIPKETGIVRVTSTKAGQSKAYEFIKVYLLPFSDRQINKYLYKRYPMIWHWQKRRKARQLVYTVPLLSVRPLLLTHIPELLETQTAIRHNFELYEALIEAWLMREAYWVDPTKLRQFSERLAIDIYVKRVMRGGEHLPREELSLLADEWNILLERWKLSTRSLLNRDAAGNYKFAHRSIMEYLFIRCPAGSLDIDWEKVELTDQMSAFVQEIVKSSQVRLILNAPNAHLERANLSGANLSGANLSRAILQQANLQQANLSGVTLLRANLSGAIMSEANLSGANLKQAIMSEANLKEANLQQANLQQARLVGADLSGAILVEASLVGTYLSGADLFGTDLFGADLFGATLKRALYNKETTWPEGFDPKAAGAILVELDKKDSASVSEKEAES